MKLDLATFAFFLSITSVLQVIALYIQYRMDKTHAGLGWWVLGGVSGAMGFAIAYLREIAQLGAIGAVISNILYVSGLAFPYIGIKRFFEQREQRGLLIAAYTAFTLAIIYFSFVYDHLSARRALNSAMIATFSFLIAHTLMGHKIPSVRNLSNSLSPVFLIYGSYFLLRTLTTLLNISMDDGFMQFSLYMVTLTGSMLWTFGFIMLINQRLNAEIKRAEAERHESEKRYQLLANHANDVIWTVTPDGRFTYVSPSVFQMRGFTPQEVIQQPLEQAFCPGSLATLQELLNTALADSQPHQQSQTKYFEIEQPCKDGTTVWTEATARVVHDEAGQPIELVIVSRDITERKHLKEHLQQQATTDDLTGIPNRRHFLQLASNELKRAIRLRHSLSIALIDIDYFKRINDTYGHAVGDQVLIEFAKICQTHIRETDSVARFGGDEFVLLFPGIHYEQARMAIERIRMAVASLMIRSNGKTVAVTISCGLASLLNESEVFDSLLSRADQALYQAKEAGRNRIIVKEDISV